MDKNLSGKNKPSLFRCAQEKGIRGIFLNASTQYYADELREYPEQFGMQEYYAREYLEKKGYVGASGWGYHNDVIYDEALELLEKYKNELAHLNEELLTYKRNLKNLQLQYSDLRKRSFFQIERLIKIMDSPKYYVSNSELREALRVLKSSVNELKRVEALNENKY